MYKRIIDLRRYAEQKSLLLLGPRQTGKSTLLRQTFPEALYIDLLEADTFRRLSSHPEYLRQSLQPQQNLVILDEVQKLPGILDEVQLLIDRNPQRRFILTGSSARKLLRGGANLLAGRLWVFHLHPLVSAEVGVQRLEDRLIRGSLPAILDSSDYGEDLRAYVGTYLREEIQAEGLARSIGAFSRFLDVAGLCNGQLLKYTEVANDCGVPARTVREWYQLLTDTLLGYQLEPYRKTPSRKSVATPKYYLFDTGVTAQLQRRQSLAAGTPEYGQYLEHLVLLELLAWKEYKRKTLPLTFWRTPSQLEVDFVLGDEVAIEVKASANLSPRALAPLRALAEEIPMRRRIVVSLDSMPRRTDDGIEIMPITAFLTTLWAEGSL